MMLVIYFLKVMNVMNSRKNGEKSKSQPEETISERLKADDADLSDIPKLECNGKVKWEPKQTIAERIKLKHWERKITGKGLKIFNSEQMISWSSNIINTNKRKK